MTRPQPRYQPGDRIAGRYQVHQALMGGMGEVYLCQDLEEKEPYALKTFQRRYQSDALREAFEMEVATWVALEKHANIVRCFHMEILDNQPFMILEWISGEEGRGSDLHSHLRDGPIDLNRSLKLILDICYGLQHAQQKQPGLVHRDLKPQNILVAQGDQAKITDFGLAQIVARVDLMPNEAGLETIAGQTMMSRNGVAGTPGYMAPEQWRGETLDQRTDIYALGCIWHELLTGQLPFSFDYLPTTPQELEQRLSEMQHQYEQTKRPDLVEDIPAPVNDLIQACLFQHPAKRPANLADLIEQVQSLYQLLLNQTPPPTPIPGEMTAIDYNNRGITYAELGQHEAALADYDQAINFDPSSPKIFFNRGNANADLGRFDTALADFNKALILGPNYAKAYVNRGNTYHAMGQIDAALRDYNQAIDLDPSYAEAYFNRGNAYHAARQLEAAFSDYNQAIDLDPGDAGAHLHLGALLGNLGRYKEALSYLENAAQLGNSQAMQYAAQVKQMIRQDQELDINPKQAALNAFAESLTFDELRRSVMQHSTLRDINFVDVIGQVIAGQVPPEHQSSFEQRLTWLRQIIQEQSQ